MVQVKGEITRLFATRTNWSAGEFRDEDGRFRKFAGAVVAQVGDRLVLSGQWVDNDRFGRQLQVDAFVFDEALDDAGLRDFLTRCDAFRGIGASRADAIVEACGGAAGFEDALAEPSKLAADAKVPVEVVNRLATEWSARREVNVAMADLASYSITPAKALKLIQEFGTSVVGIIRQNPYWLIGNVSGFGFVTVDEYAIRAGFPKDGPERIKQGLLHVLREQESDGNTWTMANDLVRMSTALLGLGRDAVVSRLIEMARSESDGIRREGQAVFLAAAHRAESNVIDRLESERAAFIPPSQEDIDGVRSTNASLTEEQAAAVDIALRAGVSVISGGAGVGKTYVIQTILALALDRSERVVLCAPTGKAAVRMSEVCGYPARTIHSTLEPGMVRKFHADDDGDPDRDLTTDDGRRDVEADGEARGELVFAFQRDASNPLDADVVIVDEVSMVDVKLMARLLDAVPGGCRVVLVGDHNQLPSVGPGAVLRDVIEHELAPVTFLTRVHRNAGELKRAINGVLDGRVVPSIAPDPSEVESIDGKPLGPWHAVQGSLTDAEVHNRVVELFSTGLRQHAIEVDGERRPVDDVWDVQLLTPTHKGLTGRRALNIALQRIAQGALGVAVDPVPEGREPRPLKGDKVIFTKNDYTLGVMNGSMGRVMEVDPKTGTMTVLFDGIEGLVQVGGERLRNLQLAYAVTIHKSQGSEFPVVVTVIHKSQPRMLHHRALVYTAVSRARVCSMVIGDSWAVQNAARKELANNRRTLAGLRAAQATVASAAAAS